MSLIDRLSSRRESVLRTFLATAIAVIVGLAMIAFTGGFEVATFRSMVQNVGSFLIATVGLALLWELVTKQSLLQEIRSMFQLSEGLRRSGITALDLSPGWFDDDTAAKEVDILYACSEEESWPHEKALEKLVQGVQSPGGRIRIFLPDPHTDHVVWLLGRRLGDRESEIHNRLEGWKTRLLELSEAHPSIQWEIFVLTQPPGFSYFRADDRARVWLCKHVKDLRTAPLFRFREGGDQFEFFAEELEAVLKSPDCLRLPASPKAS